jgi:protein TonB
VNREFPDLVVVATGRQTDAPLLGTTISEGLVYRFMHKPLSPNRAGMFLDHAIRYHAERRERSGIVQALLPTVTDLPPRVERRYWYGAAAAVCALLVALGVYLVQREPAPTATLDGVARAPGAGVPPEVLLPRADAALEAGRLEAPAGDNALDLYRDVLLAQPNDGAARAGLERATGLVLAQAHAESVAGRGDEARRLVRRVLGVDPANPLALAMQARLETPERTEQAAAEPPTESLMTLLRREFSQTRRTTPRAAARAPGPAATTPRSLTPSAPPPQASPSATPPSSGAGAAPLLAATSQGVPTAQAAARAPTPESVSGATSTPAAPQPAADPAGRGPSLVPLREFSRVSTTQPEYPEDARRAGTEGWVRLEFTVNERGQVRDIVVVGAEPRGVFEDAAQGALSRWRFRPPVAADGQPVPLRTSVQLRFELED